MKKVFKIEIDCAGCAAKCERAMAAVEGVKSVNVNFMTQKMTFEADDANFDSVLKAAIKAAKKVEDEFEVEL